MLLEMLKDSVFLINNIPQPLTWASVVLAHCLFHLAQRKDGEEDKLTLLTM